jgi:hypothetical protein
MHFRRPLVLVVHDDPRAGLAQANGLTQAGYRCLVTGDPATALWFAMRFALEATTLDVAPGRLQLARDLQQVSPHPGIVLLSPTPIPVADLPENMVCLLTPAADAELVDAVERASRLHFARPTRTSPIPQAFGVPAPLTIAAFNTANSAACS